MEWNQETDLLIAERVLRATREGDVLDGVWRTLADSLGCTHGLCKERWDSVLKPMYQTAFRLAEKQRELRRLVDLDKQAKPPAGKKLTESSTKTTAKTRPKKAKKRKKAEEIDVDAVIAGLRKWKKERAKTESEPTVQKENHDLRRENEALRKEIDRLRQDHEEIKSDYRSLLAIVQRAKDMTTVG